MWMRVRRLPGELSLLLDMREIWVAKSAAEVTQPEGKVGVSCVQRCDVIAGDTCAKQRVSACGSRQGVRQDGNY